MTAERFAAVWRAYGLPEGCTVTAALSGGADSVALLHLLKSLPDRRFTLRAAHVNHGLRGENALRDQQFAERLCAAWEIPLQVFRGDARALAKERGLSPEEGARALRYGFLDPLASGERQFVATAHHREDQAETFFINLYRGSGSGGLRGMAPRRGGYLHPLLSFPKAELAAYAAAHGLPCVNDETNADTAYLRNYLRHEVLPLLNARREGDFSKGLAASMAALAEEHAALEEWAARCTDTKAEALAALPPAVLKRVLDRMNGAPLERAHFIEIRALLQKNPPAAQLQLPGGRYFRLEYGDAVFTHPAEERVFPVEPGVPVAIEGGIFILKEKEINSPFTHFCVDCDKIKGKLILRHKRPGDQFRPASGRGTARLQKRLKNDRVPRSARDTLWVLAEEEGRVLWVERYGADACVCCNAQTRRAWEINLER